MGDSRDWSWVDEAGVEHALAEDELTLGLSSEEIPAYALVIHASWAEWLPAMQVAELRWALPPGQADAPQKPRLAETGPRSAPPLERYSELRQRGSDLRAGKLKAKPDARLDAPVTPTSSTSAPKPAMDKAADKAGKLEPRAYPFTDSSDELTVATGADYLQGVATHLFSTRAVALAVHEQAQSAAANPKQEDSRPSQRLLSQVPLSLAPPAAEAEPEPVVLLQVAKSPEPPAVVTPPSSRPQVVTVNPQSSLPPRPSLSSQPSLPPRPSLSSQPSLPPRPSLSSTPSLESRSAPAVFAEPVNFRSRSRAPLFLLGLVLLGLVGGGVWWQVLRTPEPPAVAVAESTPAPEPLAPAKLRCKVSGGPTQIWDFAKPEIPPAFALTSDAKRVALGYAQTSRFAFGLTLDPQNLTRQVAFKDDQPSPIFSVVPNPGTSTGAEIDFLVERTASTLQSTQTVRAKPPFAFGFKQKSLAVRRDKTDFILWELPWETISVPSVERVDAKSHAFALRGGGHRGSVLLGKLTEQGEAMGKLVTLALPATRLGEPRITVSESKLVVVVDGGVTPTLGELYVAVSRSSELPATARKLDVKAEQPSLPGVVALPDGSFYLHWTQGVLGNQQVAGQLFDENWKPEGEVTQLSPRERDSHHGTSVLVGDRLVTAYFTRAGQAHELWGTVVECKVENRTTPAP